MGLSKGERGDGSRLGQHHAAGPPRRGPDEQQAMLLEQAQSVAGTVSRESPAGHGATR
jgi:hypothetical protein